MAVTILSVLEKENILNTNDNDLRYFLNYWGHLLKPITDNLGNAQKRNFQCSYHNLSHLIGVGQIMLNMCTLDDATKSVLAGVYHDYWYEGYHEDCLNVETSINYFEKFFGGENLKNGMVEEVSEAIWDTCFPYKEDPKTELGKMLRDADMLYGMVYCNETLLRGLYEARKNIDGHKSFKTFLERNIDFISNVKIWTEEGRRLREDNIEKCLEVHRELVVSSLC